MSKQIRGAMLVAALALIVTGCAARKPTQPEPEWYERVLSVNGTVTFDGVTFHAGELVKIGDSRTPLQYTAEESAAARAALKGCADSTPTQYRIAGLPDGMRASVMFTCLVRQGWTVQYDEVIIN